MTNAQDEALEKIVNLIREHFEGGVVIVETDCDDGTQEREIQWHGGLTKAMGLCDVAKMRIVARLQFIPLDDETSE